MTDLDAPVALAQLGGVATRAELLVLVERPELRRAVAAREVRRVAQGRYVLPGLDETAAAAHRLDAVVSHLSAALLWDWKVKTPPAHPMLTVPAHRNLSPERRAGVELHYADLASRDVTSRGSLQLTGTVRTVVDCARTLDFDAALAVADSALRGGVLAGDLRVAASALPRTGRARALRVVEAADGDAANPFESVLRAIALDVPGLRVRPQFGVPGVGRVDLADFDRRIVLEADSYTFHAPPDAFAADVRRYTAYVREVLLDLVRLRTL